MLSPWTARVALLGAAVAALLAVDPVAALAAPARADDGRVMLGGFPGVGLRHIGLERDRVVFRSAVAQALGLRDRLSPAAIVAGVLRLLTVAVYALWWRRMLRGGRWIVPPAIGLAGFCGIGLLQSRQHTEVVSGPGLPLWAATGAMLVTAGLMVYFAPKPGERDDEDNIGDVVDSIEEAVFGTRSHLARGPVTPDPPAETAPPSLDDPGRRRPPALRFSRFAREQPRDPDQG